MVRCKVRALIVSFVSIKRKKVRALTDWWLELNWFCRRLVPNCSESIDGWRNHLRVVILPGQNLLRILWMYVHEIKFRRPGTSSMPLILSLQEVSTKLGWPSIWLKISYFIVTRHIDMRVISCKLWGIWLFQPLQPKRQGSQFTSGFSSASREVRSPSCHRTHV